MFLERETTTTKKHTFLNMMKLTKPTSSPGRTTTSTTTTNHPPPLMKFLRNKSTSTRRRRVSRPMFFRNKKHTQISNTQQEPSSPKVTCIGQIKHSNKKNQTPNRFCQCLRNLKLKLPTSFCNVFTKCVSFFRCGCCEKNEVKKDGSTGTSDIGPESSSLDSGPECPSNKVDESLVVVIKSPPKNAFLLTRCRSAPYRSSSLASKLLCEPSVEEEVKSLKIKKDEDKEVNEGVKNGDEELMVIKRIEGFKEMPLFLTRCKSDSGRKWDKFLV